MFGIPGFQNFPAMPDSHEKINGQAWGHSLFPLGPSLSDYCIKGENVLQQIWEGGG